MVTADTANRVNGLTVELPHGATLTIAPPEEARLAAILIEALSPSR